MQRIGDLFARAVLILAALAATLTPWPAAAQENNGQISGTITDTTGAVVPKCSVQAIATGTGLKVEVQSDNNGSYVFPNLPVGTYNLRVQAAGFNTMEQTGVVLDAASKRTVDFTLSVGGLAESVSVSATVQQVQTMSGDVGAVIDETQWKQIPMNGGNYTQMLRTIPGAATLTLDPMGVRDMGLSTTQSSINGVRVRSMNFLLDGGGNLDEGSYLNQMVNPSLESIAEVKVESSSFSAEFGGYAGAMVNVVSKSGTSQFHGSAFEFVRTNAMDARSFFAQRVESLHFNDFGWTLGGPV